MIGKKMVLRILCTPHINGISWMNAEPFTFFLDFHSRSTNNVCFLKKIQYRIKVKKMFGHHMWGNVPAQSVQHWAGMGFDVIEAPSELYNSNKKYKSNTIFAMLFECHDM